jgi:hypothetical protein
LVIPLSHTSGRNAEGALRLRWIIAAALLVYGVMLLERNLAACCESSDKSRESVIAHD